MPDGTIYEFQYGTLSANSAEAREREYGDRLHWIYRFDQRRWDRLWNDGDGWWKWAKPVKTLALLERPISIHHHDRLFRITEIVSDKGRVRLRFERGERDEYGPVLYKSTQAPFDVDAAVDYLERTA